MKSNVIILSILLMFCCSCMTHSQKLQGQYFKYGKDYKYNLFIGDDSSFVLSENHLGINSKCEGKWRIITDTLFLRCGEEGFPAQIERGYMSNRDRKIIILKDRKLKIDNIIMEKTK